MDQHEPTPSLPFDMSALMANMPAQSEMPKAWATLTIDMRLMTEEQRDKVQQAVLLLYEAGLSFDRGVGFGGYDIELDWSLRGAFLNLHPLHCFNRECPFGHALSKTGFSPAYWTTFERLMDAALASFPACSSHCLAAVVRDRAPAYRVLSHEVAEAWVIQPSAEKEETNAELV